MLNASNNTTTNSPRNAGRLAGRKEYFGEFSRYAIFPVNTRFENVMWFVTDAELEDEVTGAPLTIRQEDSKADALRGLI